MTLKTIILILMFFALMVLLGEVNQLNIEGKNIVEGGNAIAIKAGIFLLLNFALIKVIVHDSIYKFKEKQNDTQI